MKKTLIALAAIAATSAFAQSSVSLYGRADAGYAAGKTEVETNGVTATTKNEGVQSHNAVSSYWGITGTEDLGGGLKANFKFEADLFPATGNTGVSGATIGAGETSNGSFNRRSNIGLSGAFGTLALGRDYNPMFNVVFASDVFGLSRLSTVGLAGNVGSTVARQVMYSTPSFSGFSADFALGNNDISTQTSAQTRNAHVAAKYVNGPLYVGVAGGNLETTNAANATKTEGTAFTATYDFGMAKVFAGYVTQKVTTLNVAGATEQSETNLGVNVPFGKFAFQAAWGRNTKKSDVAGSVEDRSGTDWALGATYSLSKRTYGYVKTGVVNKLEGNLTANTVNQKYTETNVGIVHTF
jgi:predicted porin